VRWVGDNRAPLVSTLALSSVTEIGCGIVSSNLGDWRMGVHQYTLDLLPSAFAGEASGDVSEIEDLWGEQPPSALLQELRRLLPKETS